MARHDQSLAEGRFVIDSSLFPVVITRVPARFSERELARLFDEDVRRILARNRPYGSIIDASRVEPLHLGAGHRAAIAKLYDEFSADLERLMLAECFIAPSPVSRGIVQAIRWLSPPRWPAHAATSLRDSMDWLKSELGKHDMDVDFPSS